MQETADHQLAVHTPRSFMVPARSFIDTPQNKIYRDIMNYFMEQKCVVSFEVETTEQKKLFEVLQSIDSSVHSNHKYKTNNITSNFSKYSFTKTIFDLYPSDGKMVESL